MGFSMDGAMTKIMLTVTWGNSMPKIQRMHKPPWKRDWGDLQIGMTREERREYKAHVPYWSFYWMTYWCFHGSKFSIDKVVCENWRKVFPDEEFEEDRLEFLYPAISQELLQQGYSEQKLEFPGAILEDLLPDWENWDEHKQTTIHNHKEAFMAKTTRGESESSSHEMNPTGARMTKKRKATMCLLRLMLDEEYTDQELRELVNEEVGYDFTKSRIESRRKKLNAGKMDEFGYPQPDHVVEEVGGTPTSARAGAKKPPTKPAKKKASAPPKTGKKPLFKKKKKKFTFTSKKKAG